MVHPALDIDPFLRSFFDNPYPVHAALRDAGPAVHLPRYDIEAVARYDEVCASAEIRESNIAAQ